MFLMVRIMNADYGCLQFYTCCGLNLVMGSRGETQGQRGRSPRTILIKGFVKLKYKSTLPAPAFSLTTRHTPSICAHTNEPLALAVGDTTSPPYLRPRLVLAQVCRSILLYCGIGLVWPFEFA